MKYSNYNIAVPNSARQAVNDNILMFIDSNDTQGVTQEEIFNTYTGIGGLHELEFSDFANRHEYSEAKKEIEQGQFFTPTDLAGKMASFIDLKSSESVVDLTAGHGVFCNFFPEANFYGCEIDSRAHKVAKFLYPDSNIELTDLRYYRPAMSFDFAIGNPPFNLKWEVNGDTISSQVFYFKKAAELLRPAGLVLAIVPASYINDEFFNKTELETLKKDFNIKFQVELPRTTFKNLGVMDFATKIICLQKKSEYLQDEDNRAFITLDAAKAAFKTFSDQARTLRIKINAEKIDTVANFQYRINKYLYEIKTHKALQKYQVPAAQYVEKYYTQKCPDNMDRNEWEKKHRISADQVISYLKRTVKKQSRVNIDKIELVKTNYGLKYKGYSSKSSKAIAENFATKYLSFNNAVYYNQAADLPKITNGQRKLIARKKAAYQVQATPFKEMQGTPGTNNFVNEFYWLDKDKNVCQLNDKQKHDLSRIFQKQYAILNWQQGSGKTPAGYAWSKYISAKKVFVVSTALSVKLTWSKFLKNNYEPFILVQSWQDLSKIDAAKYILISHEFLIKYERQVKRIVKLLSNKVGMILDESDEITNHRSKRTQATHKCFKKAKYKLLTTGTTTRNNIAELYPQLELLYNNSINMPCEPEYIYVEDKKEKNISRIVNDKQGKPFPAYFGNSLFKKCFNPSKATVFGIKQQNQDLYNEQELRRIIEYTIITRKFKEIAGEKYTVYNEAVYQSPAERAVYKTIMVDFHKIVNHYFQSTGNSRKDALLKIIRQIQLLIKATSCPQYMTGYKSDQAPNKALHIFNKLEQINEQICIGTTTIESLEYYASEIAVRFPDRPVFIVKGDVTFNKRGNIIDQFQASTNGILICTQQSLKSSVNIPECNHCIIESLQWNVPKIEQFYFRFIRYDSKGFTNIYFVSYHDTIEANLLALLMAKEKLNDFIKTLEYREDSDIYKEFDIDPNILNMIITKEKDQEGRVQLTWGQQKVA